jgi:hypothetical protein
MIVVGLSAWLGLAPLAAATRQWPLIFNVYLAKALALVLFPALAEEPSHWLHISTKFFPRDESSFCRISCQLHTVVIME